ncbi:MAG: BMP family ABC transporter substrate-binding protein, partial [Coriobacteriia bacterium]|nr:BMP family ABC transporter substrate-binding protein [Coriobacteriia bacterium]
MNGRIRKVLALLIAIAMVGAMVAGCSSSDKATDTGSTDKPKSDIKAAMVTDVGGLGDKSFNDQAYAGLERAQKELGVEIKALESNEIADYRPNIDQLAGAGYNAIFTVGFLMTDTTTETAMEYPDVNFG